MDGMDGMAEMDEMDEMDELDGMAGVWAGGRAKVHVVCLGCLSETAE
jgi:hypothetical protein